jgi:hypothetical protein
LAQASSACPIQERRKRIKGCLIFEGGKPGCGIDIPQGSLLCQLRVKTLRIHRGPHPKLSGLLLLPLVRECGLLRGFGIERGTLLIKLCL